MKPGMIENDMQNAMTITIHPDKAVGPVKPVNGVGQPPMVGALKDWPMMHYLKEEGIPFSRSMMSADTSAAGSMSTFRTSFPTSTPTRPIRRTIASSSRTRSSTPS